MTDAEEFWKEMAACKLERRKRLARLPIAEKLRMVEKLRDASRLLKTAKRIPKQEKL